MMNVNRITSKRIKSFQRLFLISSIVIILIMLWSCSNNPDEHTAIRPVAVRTAKPVVMDLGSRLSYMGTVHSQKEVKVIAQTQGKVISLPFEEGSKVNPGDVVARIDAPELRAVVKRLQAEKDYWCRRYEADQRLVAAEALPQEQMESSKRACLNARAALAEAESRLAKTVEKSPVRGEVLKWFVEPGQSVMPGQPLLLLGNDNLEIHAEVIEEDLQRGIAVETPAEIETGTGNRFRTKVSEIAPMSSGFSRTFTVKLPVPKSYAQNLRKGASVNINFILKVSEGAIALPLNAIADRDNNPHIFLIKDERAIQQPVKLGLEQDGWIEVSFPWNGKDAVAISNLGSLADSIPVFSVPVKEVRP